MKRIILLAAMAISSVAMAQDNKKVQDAFQQSYTLESKYNYKSALAVLKSVYTDKSYELNLRLGWLSYLDSNQTASLSYYQKAIDLMPNAIEPKFGIVYPLSVLGKWDEVIKQYDLILKLDPNQTTANYRLGLIYYNRGQFEKAKGYLDKFLGLYPFDYDAVMMSAWVNLMLSKNAEAKTLFNRALLISPGDKLALEGISMVK
jgi:tetratricopeptide (TPR) repeat protein